jgi:hypothetical protein
MAGCPELFGEWLIMAKKRFEPQIQTNVHF